MSERPARFTFGPLDRRGFLLGLRGGQLALLAMGFALALLLFSVLHAGGVTLGVALIPIAGAALGAFVPVGGRQVDEWLPVLARWITTPRVWRSDAHRRGQLLSADPSADQPVLPPGLRGITLRAAPLRHGELGIITDRQRGQEIALLRLSGGRFALLAEDDKLRHLGAWGSALAAVAHQGTAVSALQLVIRTVTEDPDAILRSFEDGLAVDADHPAAQSARQLIEDAAPVTRSQEVLLAMAISRRRAARPIKAAGGGDAGAAAVLSRVIASLQTQLEHAGIGVEGALSPRLVAQVLRESWDPSSARGLRRRGLDDPSLEGVALSSAGPQATRTAWDHHVTDGGVCHATYWVSEWPRIEVGPDFLVPLILQTHARMTFSVCMAPVDPARAVRDLEVAQTAHISDAMLREQHGFRQSVRHDREADAIERRERELADGHAEFRFSGYITVSGADLAGLEAACGEVEQAARLCRLDLRRLDGEHDLGFVYSLPLCRGLS